MNKKALIKDLIKLYQNDSLVETINIGGRPNGRYALDLLALSNQKIARRLIKSLGGTFNESDQTALQRALNRKFGDVQTDDSKHWDWQSRPKPYFSSYDKNGDNKPHDND